MTRYFIISFVLWACLLPAYSQQNLLYPDDREQYLDSMSAVLDTMRFASDKAYLMADIGTGYSRSGERGEAIRYYYRSLDLAGAMQDVPLAGTVLGRIGLMYYDMGDTVSARYFYKHALRLEHLSGDKKGEAIVMSYMGVTYTSPKALNYDTAFYYFNEALRLTREAGGDPVFESNTLANLGYVHVLTYNFKEAEKLLLNALEMKRKQKDLKGQVFVLNMLGELMNRQKKHSDAISWFDAHLIIAQELEILEMQQTAFSNIAYTYYKMGEHEKAFHYQREAFRMVRRIKNEKIAAFRDIQEAYTEKKSQLYETQLLAEKINWETQS